MALSGMVYLDLYFLIPRILNVFFTLQTHELSPGSPEITYLPTTQSHCTHSIMTAVTGSAESLKVRWQLWFRENGLFPKEREVNQSF